MLIAGAGGFVGTCGRFLIGRVASGVDVGVFPLGTFLVNIIGCFVIGIIIGLLEKSEVLTMEEVTFLMTGFCGGFTTFSTFSADMAGLIDAKEWMALALYFGLSTVFGILLVWGGRSLMR